MNSGLRLRRYCAGLLAGMLIASPGGILPAHAQTVVTPATGASASVGTTSAGRTVLNIAAPNNNGLSVNRLERLDVGPQGLVVNNSLSGGTTVLGGSVGANPNLSGRSASTILNEVVGALPSRLDGPTELFGDPAHLILANPNGVVCAGCSFVGTPRVSLTTGVPRLLDGAGAPAAEADASSVRLDVRGGEIRIEGAGLTQPGSWLDLIAERLSIDAPVVAGDLLWILAGRQYVDLVPLATVPNGTDNTGEAITADSGALFAVDAGSLGSLSAGTIYLVATPWGMGVRSAAGMASTAGDIVVTSEGSLEVGSLTSAAGITARGMRFSATGPVRASSANLTAWTDLAVDDLRVGQTLDLRGENIVLGSGEAENLDVRATYALTMRGTFRVGDSALLRVGQLTQVDPLQRSLSSVSFMVPSPFDERVHLEGQLEVGNALTVQLPYGHWWQRAGSRLTADSFALDALAFTNEGSIGAGAMRIDTVAFRNTGTLEQTIAGGRLDLGLGWYGVFTGGRITGYDVAIRQDEVVTEAYRRADDPTPFGSWDLQAAWPVADEALTKRNPLDSRWFGELYAENELWFEGPADWHHIADLGAGQSLRVRTQRIGASCIECGGLQVPVAAPFAQPNVFIDADEVYLDRDLRALGNLTINARSGTFHQGERSWRFDGLANVIADGNLGITTPGLLKNGGLFRAGGDLTFSAADIWNGGLVQAGGDVSLFSSWLVNVGTVTAGRDLNVVMMPQSAGAPERRLGYGSSLPGLYRTPVRDPVPLTEAGVHNLSVLEAGRNLTIGAGIPGTPFVVRNQELRTEGKSASNEIPLPTDWREAGKRCEFWDIGSCSVVRDRPGAPMMLAGGDMRIDATDVDNVGGAIAAGGDLDIRASRRFLSRDRILRSEWQWNAWERLPSQDMIGNAGPGNDALADPSIVVVDGVRYRRRADSGAFDYARESASIQAGGLVQVQAPQVENQSRLAGSVVVLSGERVVNGWTDPQRLTPPPNTPPAVIPLPNPPSPGTPGRDPSRLQPEALLASLPVAQASGPVRFLLNGQQEAIALRQALLRSTGRSDIDLSALSLGLDGSRLALYAAAIRFGRQEGLALGNPLSAAQQASLTEPVLWYQWQGRGDQRVLAPVLYLPESARAGLTDVPGGVLAGTQVALVGEEVRNTGYIVAEDLLAVSADKLSNEKRSAWYDRTFNVKGGRLRIWGWQVQPGGFMSAARYALEVDSLYSRSGEFKVAGGDADAEAALLEDLRARLGSDFTEEVAKDELRQEFKKKHKFGGMVVAIAVGFVAPEMLASGLFSAGSVGALSVGEFAVVQGITGFLSSSAAQFVDGGRIDPGASLKSGLTAGLTGGLTRYSGEALNNQTLAGSTQLADGSRVVIDAPLSDRLLGYTVRAGLGAGVQTLVYGGDSSSFQRAFALSLLEDAKAEGANFIGSKLEGGTLPNILAHAGLGCAGAALGGDDCASGATGGAGSAFLTSLLSVPLDASGNPRPYTDDERALIALSSVLANGLVADTLGLDADTAAYAARNEVINNYLTHEQDLQRRSRLAKAKSDQERAQIEAEYAELDARQRDEAAQCLINGVCARAMDPVFYRQVIDELAAACAMPRVCSDIERRSLDELRRDFEIPQNAITPDYIVEEFLAGDAVVRLAGGALRSLVGRVFGSSARIDGAGVEIVEGADLGGLQLFKWNSSTTTRATGWQEGDFMLALPDKGATKMNWAQNASRLREQMRRGKPIYDSYRDPVTGMQIPAKGFLRAERNLLESKGWKYNPSTGAYHPPNR